MYKDTPSAFQPSLDESIASRKVLNDVLVFEVVDINDKTLISLEQSLIQG